MDFPVDIPPWEQAEKEMAEAGFSLDKLPKAVLEQHLWADGLCLLWHRNQQLPTADELAADMFDEWDDPVSVAEAEWILLTLRLSEGG